MLYCYKDRETGKWIKGSPRSVKSLKEIQAKWKEETESDRKKLKFYKNVEFGPILKLEDDALLLDHVAPPGLHIIDLGPPNQVIKKLEDLVPSVATVLKSLGCVRDPYNDHGFDGNAVRRILNNLFLLYEAVPPKYLDLVLVLEKIKVKHVYIKSFSAMLVSQQIQSLK